MGGVVGGAWVGMFEVGGAWMRPGWIYLQWVGHACSSDVISVLSVSQDVVAWADSTESTLYMSLTMSPATDCCDDLCSSVQWSPLESNPVFSLGCIWGVLHPPIVQMYPLVSVSEAAAPP